MKAGDGHKWQPALERRRQEWDRFGRDDNNVMYRRSDGSPEPPEAHRAVAEQLLRLLEPSPEATLLDVGCGAGALTQQLLPHFAKVTATDLAPAMLERAKRVLPGVPLHEAAAHELPFADGSFSRAPCYGVFLVFPDFAYARQAFGEILRVVEPGGVIVIGDVPDVSKKRLSYEWRSDWQISPVKTTLRSWRYALQDLANPRPRGFYPLSFFSNLAAEGGHECKIVQEPPQIERSAWRVNVVIRKAP